MIYRIHYTSGEYKDFTDKDEAREELLYEQEAESLEVVNDGETEQVIKRDYSD